jgi:hypothetical protein
MANTTVGASVQVEFASVGQMRKAIKEATSDLIAMTEKFGATSEQAINAAKRVASLKDSMGDAKALADTFNPDKKFVALGGALQGAVAGFSALQGAIGLFGSESKEVEKVLLKVQSAMALQQGISGIAGAMDSFNMLAGTIKTKVVSAFSTLKGAIISTGIGALAVAVGLIIANFDEFKKAIFRLVPGLETVANFVGGLVTQFTDFIGVTSEAERNLDKFTKANKKANEGIDAQIKLLEAQGGKEDQVYNLKKKRSENELNNLRETIKVKGKLTEEEKKQFRDLKNEQAILDINESNRKKKLAEDDAKELAQKQEKLTQEKINFEKQFTDFVIAENERRKKLRLNDFDKERFDIDKKYADLIAKAKKYNLDTSQIEGLRFQEAKDLINKNTKENKKGLDVQLGDFKAMVPQMATQQSAITVNQATEANTRKIINESEVESRRKMANDIAGILNGISDIFGKETAAGKATAIAAATINTYLAASQALTGIKKMNPFGAAIAIAQAALIVANGIRQVKAIASVQVPKVGGGGGGAIPSVSGGGGAPVSAEPTPTVTAQALNAQAINQLGNQSMRAYILNSDMQNNEQRNAYLERNARLG